jgi:response regulator RpfG family c-di-GMP phosphodiesterase
MGNEVNRPGESPALPILIVDDEEIVLVALRDTLIHEGYNIVSSPHAVHALTVLETQKFSAIITDQQMPMVTGLEFLTMARQMQPEATRILITAVLNVSTVIDAINKAEIHRFVVKPWSREELLSAVKSAVERYNLISTTAGRLAELEARNRDLEQLVCALKTQLADPKGNRPSTSHL